MYQGALVAMRIHLYFPDMGASGGPPDRARLVLHRTDELLTQ